MKREAAYAARSKIDLSPYAGLWVAMVRDQITGIGATPKEARHASKTQRPKDEPVIYFVRNNSMKKKKDGFGGG